MKLLTHFWASDNHPALLESQARDWVEDLAEFDIEVVEWACREWRQTQTKRPTPAGLRQLAIARQAHNAERAEVRALPPPGHPPKRKRQLASWEPGYSARYQEPWFQKLSDEQKQIFMQQDLDRADAKRRIAEARTAEERVAATEAFMALCRAQADANLASVPMRAANPANETLRRHGATATRHRWKDDGAVRDAAWELRDRDRRDAAE